MAETSKIRIKMGEIEVEYEGTESFLRDELTELLAAVSKLHHDSAGTSGDRSKKVRTEGQKGNLQGTVGTIAAKLGCKVGNGRDLITAAAARLKFVLNQDSFTRADLLKGAKTATAYYKKGVANNLSNTLEGLVKAGDFTEISEGTYSLSAPKMEELEKRLAS